MGGRRQQKLLGFGPRWQNADSVVAIQREGEVRQALNALSQVYRQQRQDQHGAAGECSAVLDPARHVAQLTERRGHVVETFGHREAGEWVLELEEALYLAERGTLVVYARDGASDCGPSGAEDERPRRMSIQELYQQVSRIMPLNSYLVYAHLRRVGYTLRRAENSELTVQDQDASEEPIREPIQAIASSGDKWMSLPPEHAAGRSFQEWSVCASSSTDASLQAARVQMTCLDDAVQQSLLRTVTNMEAQCSSDAEPERASLTEMQSTAQCRGFFGGKQVFALVDGCGDVDFMELSAVEHPFDRSNASSPRCPPAAVRADEVVDVASTAAKRPMQLSSSDRYAALRRRVTALACQADGKPRKVSVEETPLEAAWI